jgi:hypothetical protein
VDLSFPVDISIPSTPAALGTEVLGRPFDDLLDDGLAQALAAAPGLAAHAVPLPEVSAVETPSITATALPAIDALTTTAHIAGHPVPDPAAQTRDPSGHLDVATEPLAAALASGAAPTDPAALTAVAVTTVAVAAAASDGAPQHLAGDATASISGSESSGPTATSNQAQAVGATTPRALDPARVAITRQSNRSTEAMPDSSFATAPDAPTTADASTAASTATESREPRDAGQSTSVGADGASVMADTSPRSGGGETRLGPDSAATGTDTFGSFATDKVRYLRDLAPSREIQRLAIDLDDARVAVRFAEGAATVDVMSDPSSRLDSGWVNNVEKTLRQLDRPLDPTTAGEPSPQHDHRDTDDADSRRRHTPDHEQPQPSIDDERIRRWQDATQALMTTPNTRN